MKLCFYFSLIALVSPYCVSVHSLCYEQTVMFVNTLRLYIGLEVSLRLEKNFDARPVGRVLIHGSYR